MEAFVWNERFVTGFETIDAQHHRLFDLINRVGDLLLEPDDTGPATLKEVFSELTDYANTHFRDEETLMREASLPPKYIDRHIDNHRKFAEQIKTMWDQRDRMSAPTEILHGFLVAWLTYHILAEDQLMARAIRRRREGLPPEEALQDEPERGERSSGALLQALRKLYGVLSRLNHDLTAANRDLESRIEERTHAVTEVNRKLQAEHTELLAVLDKVNETQGQLLQAEKMAAIGQLAAGVAHEINNPIGFVNSNLGSLGRYVDELMQFAELGAATPAGQALKRQIDLEFLRTDLNDLLRESRDGLDRVRRIVADLKDFSHVGQAEWQDADLLAGLESTLNVAWHELKYKAEIVRELAPLPAVRCMPAQINQVLLNLLVNAAQAIRTHGTIVLRSGVQDALAWVEVADDGCGMDETTRRRMFEPFFTTKPVGQGTGLGMSLTYDIVAKHGGRLDVDSAPGKGTRIRLWLPVAGPSLSSNT